MAQEVQRLNILAIAEINALENLRGVKKSFFDEVHKSSATMLSPLLESG